MGSITEIQLRLKAEKIYCDLILAPVTGIDRSAMNKHWLSIVDCDSNNLNTLESHIKGLQKIHDNYYTVRIKEEL